MAQALKTHLDEITDDSRKQGWGSLPREWSSFCRLRRLVPGEDVVEVQAHRGRSHEAYREDRRRVAAQASQQVSPVPLQMVCLKEIPSRPFQVRAVCELTRGPRQQPPRRLLPRPQGHRRRGEYKWGRQEEGEAAVESAWEAGETRQELSLEDTNSGGGGGKAGTKGGKVPVLSKKEQILEQSRLEKSKKLVEGEKQQIKFATQQGRAVRLQRRADSFRLFPFWRSCSQTWSCPSRRPSASMRRPSALPTSSKPSSPGQTNLR